MAEQKEQKYNPGELYQDLNKYYLAGYANEQLKAGNEEQGQLAGMTYLVKNSDLEGLLKVTGFDKTPREAVQTFAQIYQRKFHELKVADALDYIKAPDELKEGLAKYLTKTVGSINEGALKFQKAMEDSQTAETHEEAISALNRKIKYRSMAKTYRGLSQLNSVLMKEKAAPELANYERKQIAEKYKDLK